jgi:glutamate-1-semialdehyde 2,1-aminomutase
MQGSRRRSAALYRRASRVMVGGVSSPVRAFKAVGGSPIFMERGRGSRVWDVDGNCYTDYVCSWGALILGHSYRRVLRDVAATMRKGTSFGAPTVPELRLAEKICAAVPSIEKVRFVNSGTEATMSALRVARAYTGRPLVVKFEGCYHGHADPFLSMAGSGMATLDIPHSAGVTEGSVKDTLTLPFNGVEALETAFRRKGDSIAAVIVEPVAGNMGVVPAEKEFLNRARALCRSHGALLIFDEVITGFRIAYGGAQEALGVTPDLTALGKVIGGGFPVGAYGGSRDVMSTVAPEGKVYQAGTLSGNPVAMAAGLSTLGRLGKAPYSSLEKAGAELEEGLLEGAERARVEFHINRAGSMLGLFFHRGPTRNFADAKETDAAAYRKFFWGMLEEGVYLPPSAYETAFLSFAHSKRDVGATIRAAGRAFKRMKK